MTDEQTYKNGEERRYLYVINMSSTHWTRRRLSCSAAQGHLLSPNGDSA
jgi:hypothetical protein